MSLTKYFLFPNGKTCRSMGTCYQVVLFQERSVLEHAGTYPDWFCIIQALIY